MRARIAATCAAGLIAFGSHVVDAVEIEGLPKPAEPRPAKVLAPHEKTLANGLRVIVVERPGLPLVSAQLLLRSGSEADPAQSAGLASFAAAMLTRGTTTRTATQIAREIEALGGTLKAEAGWDGSTVALAALSAQIEPAFALLADVVRNPKFAPAEIERLRRQTLDELRVSFEEPRTIARLAASRVLPGSRLYAHPAGGTPASIQRLRREEIVAFHSARYSPGQTQLIVAGHVTADGVFALAEKLLGDWTGPAAGSASSPGKPEAPAKPRAVLIDMPNAGQAAVVLAAPTITRRADDYFAGLVANAILGGGYTSRLNQEIRLKRGLSYGAASSLGAFRDGGIFTARCQTKNTSAGEVITVMRAELHRLATEPAPAEFFASRQAVLAGDLARDLETNGGYVDRVADLAMHGLPLDTLGQYFERIQKVTVGDALTFAASHLSSESMTVVVAGRAKDCAKPLRAIFPSLEIIPQADLNLDAPSLRRPMKR